MHGFFRGAAAIGVRRGELNSRLVADPQVKADPVPFYDEVRGRPAFLVGEVIGATKGADMKAGRASVDTQSAAPPREG